jgi:hypothetical protein
MDQRFSQFDGAKTPTSKLNFRRVLAPHYLRGATSQLAPYAHHYPNIAHW